MGWTGGHVPFTIIYISKIFLKNKCRVAEWAALQTGNRGDPSSIPAEVETFFGGIKSLKQYNACHF